ncbi:MAG: thioredoxin family protein [Flavobacteriales bacterium]|nr:thioredoxin family protein [Flavobacteriales bacterium]
MKDIKIFGPGCPKCKTLHQNTIEAVKLAGIEANITKVEDIMEMMKYNVLTTPVLMIDGVMKVKGRVADVNEIRSLIA